LALGNPARLVAFVCVCGRRLIEESGGQLQCNECARSYRREGAGILLE
jgi:hypothetical protein